MADQRGNDPASTSSSVNQESIGHLITLFSSPLTSEWTRKRAPYNFRQSFRTTQALAPDNTARIFLDRGGFKAWIAHHLTTTGQAHFNGRQARQQLIEELDNLPVEERARIAERIADSSIHPSVEGPIQSMEQQTLETRAMAIDTVGSKRRRQDEPSRYDDDDCPISPPNSTLPTNIHSRDDSRSAYTDPSQAYTGSGLSDEEGQVATGASIEGLLSLFPEYFSDAIRKDGTTDHMTAAVTMNFPRKSFGDVSCIMTLVVEANKVERLAMLLFRAHLESTGETREVVLQDGARLLPNPHVVLQGSHSDAVSEIFGPETAAAIAAAPFRRRERVAGTRATRCVTMTISRESCMPATITLTLGLREGFEIFNKLYLR